MHIRDKSVQKKLYDYLVKRIILWGNSRFNGKPLRGNLYEFWRYGVYRLIGHIKDQDCTVLTGFIGHYRGNYEK
ncbi:type II toxin-antitoxin system RelE family toxin [Candidatus Odyssella thessalonicensis]|uniref:type II toxin-antitoxin system RelE family toxin n=1 Tax=Candidatus Odyssella thessalonicensis TaxID=84647 RepID=UPI00094B43F2|nr:hypothetical protein [Candidatus Odyssella thessalonicensis]